MAASWLYVTATVLYSRGNFRKAWPTCLVSMTTALRHVHHGRSLGYKIYPSICHQFALNLPLPSLSRVSPSLKEREQSIVFMSSTGQATPSTHNIQLIIEALDDYAKLTGIDLSKNPFTEQLKLANSPEAILELLQEREKAFEKYRDGNRRLVGCLSPAVTVFHAFSRILGEAVNLVSHITHMPTCNLSSSESLVNVTSSGPLPTSKRIVCWDRCSPCCTSLESARQRVPL